MPFDGVELDTTTLLLLALRDRLTSEYWRPCCLEPGADFDAGQGCLIQQLYHAAAPEHRIAPEYGAALERLMGAVGVRFAGDLGKFSDSHTLEEVQAVVDKAIGQ